MLLYLTTHAVLLLADPVIKIGSESESESESELLLVTRSNDNHSPGPVMREVSP